MKTILYVFFALFIGSNLTSCTPKNISDTTQATEACCDEDGPILPPPPPTPPNGG